MNTSTPPFGFGGNIYGANFFPWRRGVLTVRHVIIGTIFLFVCLLRVMKGAFHPREPCRVFEAAAW